MILQAKKKMINPYKINISRNLFLSTEATTWGLSGDLRRRLLRAGWWKRRRRLRGGHALCAGGWGAVGGLVFDLVWGSVLLLGSLPFGFWYGIFLVLVWGFGLVWLGVWGLGGRCGRFCFGSFLSVFLWCSPGCLDFLMVLFEGLWVDFLRGAWVFNEVWWRKGRRKGNGGMKIFMIGFVFKECLVFLLVLVCVSGVWGAVEVWIWRFGGVEEGAVRGVAWLWFGACLVGGLWGGVWAFGRSCTCERVRNRIKTSTRNKNHIIHLVKRRRNTEAASTCRENRRRYGGALVDGPLMAFAGAAHEDLPTGTRCWVFLEVEERQGLLWINEGDSIWFSLVSGRVSCFQLFCGSLRFHVRIDPNSTRQFLIPILDD